MTAPKIGPLDAVAGTANQAGLECSRRKVEYVCDCADGKHECADGKHEDCVWTRSRARSTNSRPHMLARTEITVMGPWEVVT